MEINNWQWMKFYCIIFMLQLSANYPWEFLNDLLKIKAYSICKKKKKIDIQSRTEILDFFNCYRIFLQPQIPTVFSDC